MLWLLLRLLEEVTVEGFSLITCYWPSLSLSSWCHQNLASPSSGNTWEANDENPRKQSIPLKLKVKQSFCIVRRLTDIHGCADDCQGRDVAKMIFKNLFVRSLSQVPSWCKLLRRQKIEWAQPQTLYCSSVMTMFNTGDSARGISL